MVDGVRRALVTVVGLSVLASMLVGTASAADAATNPPRRFVSAWLPYWSLPASTASVVTNKDLFTDASPFWFTASAAGTVTAHTDSTTRLSVTSQLRAAGLE